MVKSVFFLAAYSFILGMRHGVDLDHLATIDAMTRQIPLNKNYAKWVGCLFSIGHGFVVLMMCLGLSLGVFKTLSGSWLEPIGEWISIFFLIIFGIYNLTNLKIKDFKTKPKIWSKTSTPYLSKVLSKTKLTPSKILGIGALFACSFDTFTQISLFTLTAQDTESAFIPFSFAICFILGMLIVDGLNGWLIKKWLQTLTIHSPLLFNITSLVIALFSLGLGVQGILQQTGVRNVWTMWM